MVVVIAEGGERGTALSASVEHEETFYVTHVNVRGGTCGNESVCSGLLIIVMLIIVLVIQSRVKNE
jgi:hypothetical protein